MEQISASMTVLAFSMTRFKTSLRSREEEMMGLTSTRLCSLVALRRHLSSSRSSFFRDWSIEPLPLLPLLLYHIYRVLCHI